jgi:hypothetical protein
MRRAIRVTVETSAAARPARRRNGSSPPPILELSGAVATVWVAVGDDAVGAGVDVGGTAADGTSPVTGSVTGAVSPAGAVVGVRVGDAVGELGALGVAGAFWASTAARTAFAEAYSFAVAPRSTIGR